MRIVKLSDEHSHYIPLIVDAMIQEHRKTYGYEIDKEQLKQYSLKNVYCFVDSNGTLIGFFSISRFDLMIHNVFINILVYLYNLCFGRVFIYDVYIYPQFRKKGNGKKMIASANDYIIAKYTNVRQICLHPASKHLVAFYNKCGFHVSCIHYSTIYMTYNVPQYVECERNKQ